MKQTKGTTLLTETDVELEKIMFRFSRVNTLCKKSCVKTGKYDTNHDILFFGEMDC